MSDEMTGILCEVKSDILPATSYGSITSFGSKTGLGPEGVNTFDVDKWSELKTTISNFLFYNDSYDFYYLFASNTPLPKHVYRHMIELIERTLTDYLYDNTDNKELNELFDDFKHHNKLIDNINKYKVLYPDLHDTIIDIQNELPFVDSVDCYYSIAHSIIDTIIYIEDNVSNNKTLDYYNVSEKLAKEIYELFIDPYVPNDYTNSPLKTTYDKIVDKLYCLLLK